MRFIASILLAAMAIAPGDVSASDVNPFVPESIVEKQITSGATRKLPISDTTRRILLTASRQSGLRVYVFSGGQSTEGRNRIGTHRHDLGGAADLYLVDPVTDHILDMRDPDDRVCMASFILTTKMQVLQTQPVRPLSPYPFPVKRFAVYYA